MTDFYSRMYPILRAALRAAGGHYTVTVVRDLRYTGTSEFIPSELDEIHMGDRFYPQLFTHELVHAFRNDVPPVERPELELRPDRCRASRRASPRPSATRR